MEKILKLKRHNENKEIEFELRYLKSLSVRQRFELMVKKTKEMLGLLEQSGYRRPFEIIKRPLGRSKDLEDLKYLKKLKKL